MEEDEEEDDTREENKGSKEAGWQSDPKKRVPQVDS